MQNLPTPLEAGYARFRSTRFRHERHRYRQLAESGQQPHTMVISCSDSRVAPEAIFDCGPGELFVVRNVANLVPPCQPDQAYHGTSAALEFAVTRLQVATILVLGHAGCGGVKAALEADAARTSFIGPWIAGVRALDDASGEEDGGVSDPDRLTRLERQSIRRSLANLSAFPFVAERQRAGTLALHGAWFDIATGELWVPGAAGPDFSPLPV